MGPLDTVADPRSERTGVCGVTRMVGATEMVCVAKVHDDAPRPGRGQRSVQPQMNGLWGPYPPRSERHYFVARWPYRTRA